MDYSRLRPGSSPTRTAKDFLDEGDVVMAGLDATQHMVTNFDIRVDGDTAICRAHFRANHWIESRVWTVWGNYRQQLIRAEKGWKIKHHQCRPLAQSGELLLARKSVVEGTSVSERVDLGGRRIIKKKKQ